MGWKALISVDFEGLPYIVSGKQLTPDAKLWGEARKIATSIVKWVSEALLERGFEKVYVADSHGLMLNIEYDELPDKTYVIVGLPRPAPLMVPIVDRYDVALFLGYHARAGARSTLAHTYAGRYIRRLVVNGIEASEYLLNTFYLGEKGVPVGLVAGSAELADEVSRHTPWSVWVELKKSLGYYSAVSPSKHIVKRELQKSIEEMVRRLETGTLKPLKPPKPVKVEIEVTHQLYLEIADLLNNLEIHHNEMRIVYTAATMEDALKTLELLLYAWIGAATLVR